MTGAAPPSLTLGRLPAPPSTLLIVTDAEGRLRALEFEDRLERLHRLLVRHYGPAAVPVDGAVPAPLRAALDRYFAGDIRAVDAIETATGGTDFQRAVWAALRRIPAGRTTSYGALARDLGKPDAVRAVGLANGANPISIVVPCHRVIGSDGSLTGYAGGLPRKRWLLAHEGALPAESQVQLALAV